MQTILLQPGTWESSFPANELPLQLLHFLDQQQSANTGIIPGRCIVLTGLSQGMKQQLTTDVSNSARTSGRPVISDFTCTKRIDAASVKLYDACLRALSLGEGTQRPTLLFVIRYEENNVTGIMRYSLRDALIGSIQMQSDNDSTTEQFTLNCTELLWTRFEMGAAGTPVGSYTAGWSIARNRPIAEFTVLG
jgi:type VI secretion system secreted protein Hcp